MTRLRSQASPSPSYRVTRNGECNLGCRRRRDLALSCCIADYYQYLTEVRPGEYLPTSAWDNRDEEGYDLGPQARLIVRALKGSFVLFAKFSPYERLSHATDATHEGLSRDTFRERVQLLHDVAEANPSTTTMDYLDKLLVNGDPLTTNVIR